ncbi:hypothetical protein [Labedaea rhizosphaerae]|uniref:Uncharacterized protein n=1 Tax=Labedaea rhizosphaerae TaxID=598644 RepID=A0A4R6SIA0_LABRH|nr:hypothetical protein [Labedaea rhizosphaerae]TDQ00688.1 hypothetical protein EV186_102550 [Labedaea rhizosphaerae]
MSGRRIALFVTCAVVLALGVTFVFVSTDAGNRLATIVSALGAVAAVGVAVWAALLERPRGVVVSGTGKATAGPSGTANSGYRGPANESLEVRDTGDASGDGGANTGVQID